MADPVTEEDLATLVHPLYEDEDGAIVCDFGGRVDHGDGGFSYVDGPRFRVMPGGSAHGLTYEDLADELRVREAERVGNARQPRGD